MTEAEQVAERAYSIVEQIPTLQEALGCVECSLIFRRGGECPYCGSTSLFNIADILSKGQA